jgi:hypothetical protein
MRSNRFPIVGSQVVTCSYVSSLLADSAELKVRTEINYMYISFDATQGKNHVRNYKAMKVAN